MLFSEPKIPQSHSSSVSVGASMRFQCSSASRKFLNRIHHAQNSFAQKFQCSSASRKFLNLIRLLCQMTFKNSFSALQRAENSSIYADVGMTLLVNLVSVLFSEPKIPQSPEARARRARSLHVSVLFSEPKIPQLAEGDATQREPLAVSVLFSEPKIPQSSSINV